MVQWTHLLGEFAPACNGAINEGQQLVEVLDG